MNRVDLFNNLVVMAAVDGKITDEEAGYLAQQAVSWGISEEEATKGIQNAMGSRRDFTVPPTKEGSLEVLREIIKMMAIDGQLAPVEKELCASAAVAMNVSPAELKSVLASMM
jgi:uncharacterized tellurite resistance protein B-like protein